MFLNLCNTAKNKNKKGEFKWLVEFNFELKILLKKVKNILVDRIKVMILKKFFTFAAPITSYTRETLVLQCY